MKTSFRLPMTAAGVALASCLATSALAQSFVMKFGTATVNDPQHEYIKIYKEEIEQRSGGRIKVEIYPQSQLGPIPRQLEGLQLGTIEGFIGPADFYVGVDKRFGVFSAPILFRDMTNAAATLADPELNQAILALGSDKGYVGLGTFAYAQHDYMAKDPIRTFADFKGKKIRVNATPLEREAMARLGATASPMPLNEVLPALQRNVIDGTRSGLSVFVTLKYQDVSKVVTVTNDTMLVPLATASKVWFDKLPADLQKAVIGRWPRRAGPKPEVHARFQCADAQALGRGRRGIVRAAGRRASEARGRAQVGRRRRHQGRSAGQGVLRARAGGRGETLSADYRIRPDDATQDLRIFSARSGKGAA